MGKVYTGLGYFTGRKLIVNTAIKHTPKANCPKFEFIRRMRKDP